MGFSDYDGPVSVHHLADGAHLVTAAEPERERQDMDELAARRRARQRRIARTTGPLTPDPDADLARVCDRCGLRLRVCECCNFPGCNATVADYCEHEGAGHDD